ncbi:hypothetical protein [Bradyrhizobium sp. USDA 4486]
MGRYQLNFQAVLNYYRGLARNKEMLMDAIDRLAVDITSGDDAQSFVEQGQADGSINNDPALPLFERILQREKRARR